MTDPIEKFDLAVPEADLDDLRERLARTRWPERETVPDTDQGPQLAKVQALVDHWHERLRLADLRGLAERGGPVQDDDRRPRDPLPPRPLAAARRDAAAALPRLAGFGPRVPQARRSPRRPGGARRRPRRRLPPGDPSMPGFGFSDKPADPVGRRRGSPGLDRADGPARLRPMGRPGRRPRLGGRRRDRRLRPIPWSACTRTSQCSNPTRRRSPRPRRRSGRCSPMPTTSGQSSPATPKSRGPVRRRSATPCPTRRSASPPGSTRCSRTPVGRPGTPRARSDSDEMLDDIMLYWLPNTGASAARLYWEMEASGWRPTATAEDPLEVPFGFTMLPREHVRKSRRWIERRYPEPRPLRRNRGRGTLRGARAAGGHGHGHPGDVPGAPIGNPRQRFCTSRSR